MKVYSQSRHCGLYGVEKGGEPILIKRRGQGDERIFAVKYPLISYLHEDNVWLLLTAMRCCSNTNGRCLVIHCISHVGRIAIILLTRPRTQAINVETCI